MKRLVFALILLLLLCIPSYAANLLANGDFQTGDLANWTEAGAKTISTWHGAEPVPAQVFSKDAPMYVADVYYGPSGQRHIRRSGMASAVKPAKDYSLGWTVAGTPRMGYPWVSQIVRVAPGKYRVSASWDVAASSGPEQKEHQIGGALILNTDSGLNSYAMEGKAGTEVVWNDESKGKWITKSVKDLEIDTKTGYVEVRLQMLIRVRGALPTKNFGYVTFDNVSFDLIPVE